MSCHKSKCNLRPNHSLVWALNGFRGVLFTTTKTNGPKKGQNIDCHKMECQTESTYCRPLLRARPPGRQTLTQTSGVAAALTWAGISPPGAIPQLIAICQKLYKVANWKVFLNFNSRIRKWKWKCWHKSHIFCVYSAALDLGTFSWQSGWTFILQKDFWLGQKDQIWIMHRKSPTDRACTWAPGECALAEFASRRRRGWSSCRCTPGTRASSPE